MALAPILLFVFNRPIQTKKTLEALMNNNLANESVLYIYADGPKKEMDTGAHQKIGEVREVIIEKQWCKEVHIIEAEINKGLANSIIDGVTEQVHEHGKVIVLEDDLITSKGFLKYMNNALSRYEMEPKVMQISGHQFPLNIPSTGSSFFLPAVTAWGWATWARAWKFFDPDSTGYEELKTNKALSRKFDLNGSYPYTTMLLDQMEGNKINSWAIRWWWSVFQNQGISLFPDNTMVKNIGYGQDASHTKGKNPFDHIVLESNYAIGSFPTEIKVSKEKMLLLEKLLRRSRGTEQFTRRFVSVFKNKLLPFLR